MSIDPGGRGGQSCIKCHGALGRTPFRSVYCSKSCHDQYRKSVAAKLTKDQRTANRLRARRERRVSP